MESHTIREDQLASALGLDRLRVGRHTTQWVLGVWIAHILPSFDPPATVTVVVEEKRTYGAFVTNIAGPVGAQFEDDWQDPVVDIARKIDLFDLEGAISLDGIGYKFKINTALSKTQISFSNPFTDVLKELEKAIFAVATKLVDLADRPSGRQYLVDTWLNYSRG